MERLDRAHKLGAIAADHCLIPRRIAGKQHDPTKPPSRWAWVSREMLERYSHIRQEAKRRAEQQQAPQVARRKGKTMVAPTNLHNLFCNSAL